MVKVGLCQNILSHHFKISGCLATEGTCVTNLWEFTSYLDAGIELLAKYHIQPVRKRDQSFMGWLLEEGFEGKTAKHLN